MQESTSGIANAMDAIAFIREEMPEEGLFQDKEWRLSHEPLPLPADIMASLRALGNCLGDFMDACNRLYFESAEGGRFPWVAALLDAGKPEKIVALGRHPRCRDLLPQVIRPDIILTGDGLRIAELDPLPGGIGLTAWLNATYAKLGWEVVGGPRGMIDGFAGVLAGGDILISRESADYRPEMRWIARQIAERSGGAGPKVIDTKEYESQFRNARAYRFFELWDLDHVEHADAMLSRFGAGELALTPPPKAFIEEKLWLSLFWTPGLAEFWEDALAADVLATLRGVIPFGWVVDPAPLPHFAEYPRLGIHDWRELGEFTQSQRRFALKISGFSEKSWGSRGVSIGHDLSQEAWKEAIAGALASFPENPFVLQDFHAGRRLLHPYHDAARAGVATMDGRVRLSPYYFRNGGGDTVLGGILATIAPADKKLIHGMRDAIIVPCREGSE